MRLLLRLLGVGFTACAVFMACGGSEFSSSGNQGGKGGSAGAGGSGGTSNAGETSGATGGSAGAGGTGANAGTAGGGTTLCAEPTDCDDQNPCTLDVCGASGVCEHPPKCDSDELCCDGECGQCCNSGDCGDEVECTVDECFAGFCSNSPGACADDAEYCSLDEGCVPREGCDTDAECVDSDPCTTDTCVSGLCSHAACPDGGSCCPGRGCGSCCSDSQCPHDNPCEPSVCGADLACESAPLCGDEQRCCPSPDFQTAVCGECCGALDCADDGVDCTIEKCKLTAEGTSACFVDLDPSVCDPGETCERERGCFADECQDLADCAPPTACKQVQCNGGSCDYGNLSCSNGQDCCPNTGHCQDCCSNDDCRDLGSPLCCAKTGTCAECCEDSDCTLNQPVGGAAPAAIVGGGNMPCTRPYCASGVCKYEAGTCALTEKCCEPYGCIPLLAGCGVMTD